MRTVFFLGALWGALSATNVSAATIDPARIMSEFNVISLENLTATTETEGTVYVGGDLDVNRH
jgi:calcineurin-like phosphoesterase family protein